jgi:DNA-directed RNA polymerase specialized sigma24 family protein
MGTQNQAGERVAWRPFGPSADERAALAQYLVCNKDLIQAIARRKLTARTKSVYDSEDVFSSVARRLDELAARDVLRPRDEKEMWALIATVACNNAISRTRLIERAKVFLTDDAPYAFELMRRLKEYTTDEEANLLVHRMLLCLPNEVDRQQFLLLLRGASHRAIGSLLGFSEEASRQRWTKVRRLLEERFAKGALDG